MIQLAHEMHMDNGSNQLLSAKAENRYHTRGGLGVYARALAF